MNQAIWQSIVDESRQPPTLAGWRNVIGEIGEQMAAEKLKAKRLSTGTSGGNEDAYCADLVNHFAKFEVKTCGLSNHVLIYRFRLDKDCRENEKTPICYVIVKHFCKIPQPNALEARAVMMETARIFVLPLRYIEGICQGVTPRRFNRRFIAAHGSCRKKYELGGYCIPWRLIEPFAMEI